MDDMHAFERQVAGEMVRRAGPVRPVDDAAIFTAITATQSPKWRFQSMFSVAKFVVAGVIVALFGGFLLAGVLTTPTEETAPAAVSPSPSPDLLSSLDTEEVAPGVYRVLSDGIREFDAAFDGVSVGPGGQVWVLRKPLDDSDSREMLKIGESGVAEVLRVDGFGSDMEIAPDGTPWTAFTGDKVRALGSYRDGTWTTHTDQDGSPQVNAVEVNADGSVWVTREGKGGAGPWVAQVTDGEWSVLPGIDDPDLLGGRGAYAGWPESFAVAADGSAWYANGNLGYDNAPAFGGLLRFDGLAWDVVAPVDDRPDLLAGPLALGADGTLWVYLEDDSGNAEQRLARLDEAGWSVYTADEGVPVLVRGWFYRARPVADAQGRLWIAFLGDGELPPTMDGSGREDCVGVLMFDGIDWTRYLEGVCVNRLATGPDGSVWATATKDWREPDELGAGLYVITPEALAATE